MSEQEIAEMCEQARIQESEQGIVDTYKNREWNPWLLGQFFNPMFWIQDNRHFFSRSDERDFNQYMENAFKTLAETYSDWGEYVLPPDPGDSMYPQSEDDPQIECFQHPNDAYAQVVFHFSNLIWSDFEVMKDCYIMQKPLEYERDRGRFENACKVKEARIEYINPNSGKTLRGYLWKITDMYDEITYDPETGKSCEWSCEYEMTETALIELHEFQ